MTEFSRCSDIIQTLFKLNALDMEVLRTLMRERCVRADALAEKVGRERSTVYRSLKKLESCGICEKGTETLPQGGYCHRYSAKNKDDLIKNAESCIEDWYASMKKALKELDNELNEE